MPLYDLICPKCGKERLDQHLSSYEPTPRCECGEEMARKFPIIGGYKAIKNNGASTRPAGSGARPKGAK